jgi:peroxin-19
MLDEFTPSKPEPKAPTTAPSTSGPGRPEPTTEEGITDDDFARQLQAGMAELLGGLESSPDMPDLAQLENIMKELGGAPALGLGTGAASNAGSSKEAQNKAEEKSFQETIKETMERMKASDTQSTAAAAEDNSEDLMAEMLKAMQASGLGEGEGGEEDFSKMLLGMMEQLTNKEILYEPMKELDDKFPAWMEKNEGKVKEEDMKRYKEQKTYVREIVGRFERAGYSDDNAADREYIVERMQKVCLSSNSQSLSLN